MLVVLETTGIRETKDMVVNVANRELKDLLVKKEVEVQMAKTDPKALRALMVSVDALGVREYPVSRVALELRDLRDLSETLDDQVTMVYADVPAHLEIQDHQDFREPHMFPLVKTLDQLTKDQDSTGQRSTRRKTTIIIGIMTKCFFRTGKVSTV